MTQCKKDWQRKLEVWVNT